MKRDKHCKIFYVICKRKKIENSRLSGRAFSSRLVSYRLEFSRRDRDETAVCHFETRQDEDLARSRLDRDEIAIFGENLEKSRLENLQRGKAINEKKVVIEHLKI